jgi:hypothetical protein
VRCIYPDCRCVGPCNDEGPRDEREGGPTNAATDLISRLRALSESEHDDISVAAEAADALERMEFLLSEALKDGYYELEPEWIDEVHKLLGRWDEVLSTHAWQFFRYPAKNLREANERWAEYREQHKRAWHWFCGK